MRARFYSGFVLNKFDEIVSSILICRNQKTRCSHHKGADPWGNATYVAANSPGLLEAFLCAHE